MGRGQQDQLRSNVRSQDQVKPGWVRKIKSDLGYTKYYGRKIKCVRVCSQDQERCVTYVFPRIKSDLSPSFSPATELLIN